MNEKEMDEIELLENKIRLLKDKRKLACEDIDFELEILEYMLALQDGYPVSDSVHTSKYEYQYEEGEV